MKILIAGLSKTGTTGLLYLVANSMAGKPRLLFEPRACPADIQFENRDVIAKILIGAGVNSASFSSFEKKITLVRDPRDRFISSLLYSQYHARYSGDADRVRMVRECLEKKEADPAAVPIRRILEAIGSASGTDGAALFKEKLENAQAQCDRYVATVPDGLLYKYEDFVSGKYDALEQHLGMRLTGAARVPDSLNRVERTKGYGDWRNWFAAEDVEEYRPLFAAWLAKYGYDPEDWALNAAPSIAAEHCSGYFMRMIEAGLERSRENADRPRRHGTPGAASRKTRVGQLVRAEPGVVAGWAIGAEANRPVRVALLVNGVEVAQATADLIRPGLRDGGMHPSGRCGFAFRFEPGKGPKVGDEISVTPVDRDFVLKNSPRKLRPASARAAGSR